MEKQIIHIITTGGTIDKSYNEADGSLQNRDSGIQRLLIERVRLPYTDIKYHSLLAKDSLDMTDDDRKLLTDFIVTLSQTKNPIIIIHGTDTMADSAKQCFETIEKPTVPVIFTGAMVPIAFAETDGKQNIIEALLAAKLLEPGVYISFHSQVFKVPQVQKNRQKGTFEPSN